MYEEKTAEVNKTPHFFPECGNMSQIHAEINDRIVEEFRDVVYARKGLKRGD